jgi:Ca2+-binding EF-hand superfamily protein
MSLSAAHAEKTEKWIDSQRNTFTKWCNNHLQKKGFPIITEFQSAWENGITLMNLVHALYGIPFPAKVNKNPKIRPQKLDNIMLALQMVEAANIKTNFLKSTHLIDCDLRMLLGMAWAIILDYAIKGIKEENLSSKEGLLLWVKKQTKGYSGVDPIQSFTGMPFRNGLAFIALIHKHRPDLVDFEAVSKENEGQPEKTIELAFKLAEENLGIPRLLEVSDLNTEKPDERSVMTYVAEYFHRFAAKEAQQQAIRRAAKFAAFLRSTAERQNRYETEARAFIAQVDSFIDRFQKEDLGSTLEDALAVNDRLRKFVMDEKPKLNSVKLDLEALYAELQTELKVNHRPPYVEPAELSPDALEAKFNDLWHAEKTFSKAAREHRFKFITKEETKIDEEKLKEFKESFAAIDTNKSGCLDFEEFKAALSAVGVGFKDDAEAKKIFDRVAEGGEKINEAQYIRYLVDLKEDRDTPEQVKQAFQDLADGNGEFITEAQIRSAMSPEDAETLLKLIPAHADGEGKFDFKQLVDKQYV